VSALRDLIPDHIASERLYLEARWSSLVSYAAAGWTAGQYLADRTNAKTLRENVARRRACRG
jgi:hypothetical protein